MTDEQSGSGGEQLIKTPCKNICVIDTETAQCIGCGRTRVEIAGWLSMDADERQAIMAELDQRVATLTSRKKRKGGSKRRQRTSSPVKIDFKSP